MTCNLSPEMHSGLDNKISANNRPWKKENDLGSPPSLPQLPLEIQVMILEYLDWDQQCTAAKVCSFWRRTIRTLPVARESRYFSGKQLEPKVGLTDRYGARVSRSKKLPYSQLHVHNVLRSFGAFNLNDGSFQPVRWRMLNIDKTRPIGEVFDLDWSFVGDESTHFYSTTPETDGIVLASASNDTPPTPQFSVSFSLHTKGSGGAYHKLGVGMQKGQSIREYMTHITAQANATHQKHCPCKIRTRYKQCNFIIIERIALIPKLPDIDLSIWARSVTHRGLTPGDPKETTEYFNPFAPPIQDKMSLGLYQL